MGRVGQRHDQVVQDVEARIDDIQIPIDTQTGGDPKEDIEKNNADTESDTIPTETLSLNFDKIQAHILGAISQYVAQYNESDLNFITR